MNIESRLKKLESQTAVGGVCDCPNVPKFEMYRADLSIESDTAEPILEGEAVPETCRVCRRPIEKRKLVFQLVDQTTKDRFPGHWDFERYGN